METTPVHVVRGYLDNVQVYLQTVQYTKVPPNWGNTVHTPDVTRLYYIREGEGWISIRNHLYRPKRGQLFLLPAGQTLSFDTEADKTFGKYWCHFTATVGDVNLFQFIDLPHYINVQDEDGLEQQFQKLLRLYQNPDLTSPLRIKAVLLEIISLFMEESVRGEGAVRAVATSGMDKINTLLLYIDEHLDSPIAMQDLANLVHFHPQYLSLYFKTMLGIPPMAYINRKRIEKAKRLLANGELTITEIASEIGWEGYYFSRLFKQQTGLSPRAYRKALRDLGGQGQV